MAPRQKSKAAGVGGLAVATAAAAYGTSTLLFGGGGSAGDDAAFLSSGAPAVRGSQQGGVMLRGNVVAPAIGADVRAADVSSFAIPNEAAVATIPESAGSSSMSSMTTFLGSAVAGSVAAMMIGSSRRQRRSVAKCQAKDERRQKQLVRRHQAQTNSVDQQLSSVSPLLPEGVYCEASNKAIRRKTRTVMVGNVPIGSEHPVAIQTMSTTLTHDVEATVAQIKRCADMGIDLVRVTVQGMREAKACEHIKRRLLEDGYKTGIVADIHFTPKVAMVCADYVDKVCVNPGNFADGRKSFDTISELTEADVKEAQDQIEEVLAPLVLKLKEQNKAMRVGVNHGSLAERILFQYGDSPEGMVASAIEFGEICRKYDFHNIIFSMKSSNPQVMVTAYRMLAREMYKRGWDYPLHLGVTEAGGGADGRIKSAVGIGALLLDGLGDTIRVSLTEDPEFEVAPCAALRATAENALEKGVAPFMENKGRREGLFSRRTCNYPIDVPLNMDGTVLSSVESSELGALDTAALCSRFNLRLRKDGDVQREFKSVDVVVVKGALTPESAQNVEDLLKVPIGVICEPGPLVPKGATIQYRASDAHEPLEARIGGHALVCDGQESQATLEQAISNLKPALIILSPESQDGVTFLARRFMNMLSQTALGSMVPVMFHFRYPSDGGKYSEDDVVVRASSEFGSLFVDGFGEGILWDADQIAPDDLRESSFNLLQAARMRITKTEFISCPSCGRTLFNLQDTTKRIQARTGHLPGVRIAVMGCIVNGPGEMADADFGYVGSGVGKVDLYVKYDVVKRAIPSEDAVEQLVELIKENGRWQEPPEAEIEVDEPEILMEA